MRRTRDVDDEIVARLIARDAVLIDDKECVARKAAAVGREQ